MEIIFHRLFLLFLSFHVTFYVILDCLDVSLLHKGQKIFLTDDDDNESSIRRACSLSDLSMGKGKKFRYVKLKFILDKKK